MQQPLNNSQEIEIACSMNCANVGEHMLRHIADEHGDVVLSAGHAVQVLHDAADVLAAVFEYGKGVIGEDLYSAIVLMKSLEQAMLEADTSDMPRC